MMEARCGWCGAFLGYRPGPDGEITHGICRTCAEKEMAEFKRKLNLTRQKGIKDGKAAPGHS